MKDKTQWSKGTVNYIHNKSNPYAAGRNDYQVTVDAVLTSINTTPDNGKNVGNHVTPTNWSYSVNIKQKVTGVIVENWPTGVEYNRRVGTYGGDPLEGPVWERTALYNRALERLNARIRDQADWAEDVAQAKSTSRALGLTKLASLGTQAVSLAKTLRRDPMSLFKDTPVRNFPAKRKRSIESAFKEGVDDVSSGILAYKYVYKPLLMNVFDTAYALLNNNEGGLWHIRGGATMPLDSEGRCNGANHGIGGTANTVSFTNTGKQGCRIHVIMRGMDANSLADFSTLDPRVLAWNLLPYSFVVDWFYSVGGYLEAQEEALRMNPLFVRGYVDELYACYRNEEIRQPTVNPQNPNFIVLQSRARRKQINFQRTVLGGWPLPRRPVFNTDLGSSRLLAAAALLGAILGRKR